MEDLEFCCPLCERRVKVLGEVACAQFNGVGIGVTNVTLYSDPVDDPWDYVDVRPCRDCSEAIDND